MSRTIEVSPPLDPSGYIELKKVPNSNLYYKDIIEAFSILLGIPENYVEDYYVKDFFSNGHVARGILSYILCSSLNNNAGHPKWSVEQGEGMSLFLSSSYSKYEFHTIDEEYPAVVKIVPPSIEIEGYFFADIACIRNSKRNVFFYYKL